MWHRKRLNKISRARELRLCWASLIHLKTATRTYEEKPHPQEESTLRCSEYRRISDYCLLWYSSSVWRGIAPSALSWEQRRNCFVLHIIHPQASPTLGSMQSETAWFSDIQAKEGVDLCKKPFFANPNSAGFQLLNSDRLEGGTIKC